MYWQNAWRTLQLGPIMDMGMQNISGEAGTYYAPGEETWQK